MKSLGLLDGHSQVDEHKDGGVAGSGSRGGAA